MTYPKTPIECRDAIFAYYPNVAEAVTAYERAQQNASPVPMIIGTFAALSPYADNLDDAGRALLCGCAAVIAKNQWDNRADEAMNIFAAILPTLQTDQPAAEAAP